MERYLYTGSHEAIIPDEMFMAVQQEKISRSKEPKNRAATKLTFWCHELIRFPSNRSTAMASTGMNKGIVQPSTLCHS